MIELVPGTSAWNLLLQRQKKNIMSQRKIQGVHLIMSDLAVSDEMLCNL